jgi:hypothetical protein
VAAFSRAKLGRLLLVQFVFALLAAAVVVWFLDVAWFPTIRAAIRQLPTEGKITAGKLAWIGDTPVRLAESRYLALSVDLRHEGGARSPAHVQVEFGVADIEIRSLLGYVPWPYASTWNVAFNREELEPWWGAWSPEILAIVAGATIIGLMLIWAALAISYWLPTWLLGFFANRDLDVSGSLRLAGAGLMPGALFFSAAIVIYGLGGLDPVQLMAATCIHLVIGWIFIFLGVLALPRHPEASPMQKNPFQSSAQSQKETT